MDLRQPTPRALAGVKIALFILCLLPLTRLLIGLYVEVTGAELSLYNGADLGANPVEFVIRDLGTWALNFLLITLCVTPLRKLTGMHWLLRMRRMLGLFAFCYALLHFNLYLGLDQGYDWGEIIADIIKRPFITLGMLTFTLMLPLALTSNAAAIRALGGKRWQRLHQLIYPLSICAVLHYWLLVKADTGQPGIYAGLLAILLMVRMRDYWFKLRQRY